MKCLHLYISGKVQHVGFRFFAMQVAYQRGVKGYVQNRKDGSLFIEVEGEEESLNGFVEWCRKGPMGAKVDEVVVKEAEVKNHTSFDVR